jgi:phosphatidate cytidylyltransferase
MNLARRVVTALVVLPPLLLALFAGPPWITQALVGLAALLGLFEFYGLLRARGLRPLQRSGLALAVLVFVEVALPAWGHAPLWPLGVLVVLIATLGRGADIETTMPAAAGSLLGAVYLGGLGGAMAALRTLAPPEQGPWRLGLLLAIIMASDTAAFFVGSAWGRTKLAPRISPHKTVEGALGGLVGGVIGALAIRQLGLPGMPLGHAVGLGLLVAGLGILGDLDESLLKRWAGVKDSGTLFPGHGGMLDRLDSLLFGAPVLYYYFLYVC